MVGRHLISRVVTENSPDRRPKSPQSIPTNRQALYEFKTPQIVQIRPVLVEIWWWSVQWSEAEDDSRCGQKVDADVGRSPLVLHTDNNRQAYPDVVFHAASNGASLSFVSVYRC